MIVLQAKYIFLLRGVYEIYPPMWAVWLVNSNSHSTILFLNKLTAIYIGVVLVTASEVVFRVFRTTNQARFAAVTTIKVVQLVWIFSWAEGKNRNHSASYFGFRVMKSSLQLVVSIGYRISVTKLSTRWISISFIHVANWSPTAIDIDFHESMDEV